MSNYTDLTSTFIHKLLITWQNMDELGENDSYLKAQFAGYRRPVLQVIGVTIVDVENNTGNANETSIVFSDGEIRTVAENTSSTHKYRRFDITAAAQFTTGTEDSGLRSGISEATNTWYAIYAVKSLIDATKFVLAGDTTLPIQANFATLNGRYGTNGWIYLGMIRNGDNKGATGDILSFNQVGNRTIFKNATTSVGVTPPGTVVAYTAGATTLTYTYSAGTGTTDIPAHLPIVLYGAVFAASATQGLMKDSGGSRVWRSGPIDRTLFTVVEMPASEGVALSNAAANNITYEILLVGFIDDVLGVGYNPVL